VIALKIIAATMILVAALGAESYTPEKMQRMAAAQKDLSEGKAADLATVVAAYEFKGYVAAILDNDKELWECARQNGLDDIVYRTSVYAAVIDDGDSGAIAAVVAVRYACRSFKRK
jgi:hypothetical protein